MRIGLLVTLVALAVAAGCGGSSEDGSSPSASEEPAASAPQPPGTRLTREQYFAAVRRIADGPGSRASELFQTLVSDQPKEECAEAARRFEQELDSVVDEAAALSPPRHVAKLHRRFLVAARVAIDGVRPALARAQAGTLPCGEKLNEAIYGRPTTAPAEAVVEEIEANGYVIFGQ
jgi:hypothetical protein